MGILTRYSAVLLLRAAHLLALLDEVVGEVAANIEAAHRQHRGGQASTRLLRQIFSLLRAENTFL